VAAGAHVLIPLKRLDDAKSRLADVLSGEERAALMLEFLQRVLAAAEEADVGPVTVVSGEQVAIGHVRRFDDRGLAWNEMTGTAQTFRRRGLARLVKLASIQWASGVGIRAISTGNDEENAGMLALNRELGYRPLLDVTELSKRV
jgi:GNAT superfamily N-acetyltransferase